MIPIVRNRRCHIGEVGAVGCGLFCLKSQLMVIVGTVAQGPSIMTLIMTEATSLSVKGTAPTKAF